MRKGIYGEACAVCREKGIIMGNMERQGRLQTTEVLDCKSNKHGNFL